MPFLSTLASKGLHRNYLIMLPQSVRGRGPAQCRDVLPRPRQSLHLRIDLPRRELEHQPPPRRVLDDRARDRVRRPLRQCGIGGALLKYTFAALLNERQEDLAFFDQRIEKGLVAKLEGIVGQGVVHLDYGEGDVV